FIPVRFLYVTFFKKNGTLPLHQAAEHGGGLPPGRGGGSCVGAADKSQSLGQGGIAHLTGGNGGTVRVGAGKNPFQLGYGTVTRAVQKVLYQLTSGEQGIVVSVRTSEDSHPIGCGV